MHKNEVEVAKNRAASSPEKWNYHLTLIHNTWEIIFHNYEVQLCVAHNRRRISARRYKGVAQITSRRARKGWTIRFNPDHHYSNAFYKDLDALQLKDGKNKLILNRDDAAGYRLGTTYTHKQYKNVSLINQPELTTRTDYVNKYKSVLQTSMHLIMATDNTSQKVLGVVKPHHLFPKNPAQHMADLLMMSEMEEFKDDLRKPIDCIRVDGATDEGPSHLEVQFLWTEWNLVMEKYCTLVTARYAGGSYLNKVEQINGCLTRAHCNMFIPSTIHGCNFGNDGLDEARLERNLRTATEVYINRCDGAPAGQSEIKLVEGNRGDKAREMQERRPSLLTFLKGSKTAKEQLKREKPDLFEHFSQIYGTCATGTCSKDSLHPMYFSCYHVTRHVVLIRSVQKEGKICIGLTVAQRYHSFHFQFLILANHGVDLVQLVREIAVDIIFTFPTILEDHLVNLRMMSLRRHSRLSVNIARLEERIDILYCNSISFKCLISMLFIMLFIPDVTKQTMLSLNKPQRC